MRVLEALFEADPYKEEESRERRIPGGTEAYRDLYIAWLDGREPTDATAKEFRPVCDEPAKAFPGWPGLDHEF